MAKSPDAFRTISEVSGWLDTPAHVLRFWESKFTQVRPVKRAGGRRYYRPEDMALLGGIKTLLHEQGLTIKGVQKLLREKGVKHVAAQGPDPGQLNGFASDDSTKPEALPNSAPLRVISTDIPDAEVLPILPDAVTITPQSRKKRAKKPPQTIEVVAEQSAEIIAAADETVQTETRRAICFEPSFTQQDLIVRREFGCMPLLFDLKNRKATSDAQKLAPMIARLEKLHARMTAR